MQLAHKGLVKLKSSKYAHSFIIRLISNSGPGHPTRDEGSVDVTLLEQVYEKQMWAKRRKNMEEPKLTYKPTLGKTIAGPKLTKTMKAESCKHMAGPKPDKQ
jgi:hypothetical protein